MPIPFTCPHCGRETAVDEQYAGQAGPCASCGKTITVPSLPTAVGRPKSSSPMIGIILAVLLGTVLVVGLLIALFLPAYPATRVNSTRRQCPNNLKQIGLAMHNYYDTYKCLPPAVITDDDGRPMRSWRVAILPFVEQTPLYDQYDFNEPWDGPNNMALHANRIDTYVCPMDGTSAPFDTSYVMIVGKDTIGDEPNEAVRFRDITDGTSNTILAIEVSGQNIHWMEPRDLTVEEAIAYVTNPAADGYAHTHNGGVNVLMTDGSTRFVPETINPQILRLLLIRNDGQPVPDF